MRIPLPDKEGSLVERNERRLKIIVCYNAKKRAGENVTEEDLKDALDGKENSLSV